MFMMSPLTNYVSVSHEKADSRCISTLPRIISDKQLENIGILWIMQINISADDMIHCGV